MICDSKFEATLPALSSTHALSEFAATRSEAARRPGVHKACTWPPLQKPDGECVSWPEMAWPVGLGKDASLGVRDFCWLAQSLHHIISPPPTLSRLVPFLCACIRFEIAGWQGPPKA